TVNQIFQVRFFMILSITEDTAPQPMLCRLCGRLVKLAAVSASHCTLVIKAILTNLFTKTLYISNIELYLANF
ncbi:hypothetical protein FU963_09640, partial [Campylobacter jejuni]|nr:hypothetical protein [Campylobacter jejuni]ECP9238975.1 hypothetical protein [Campylobacter jejuni]